MRVHLKLLPVLFACAVPVAVAADGTASGSFRYGERDHSVAHAVAWHSDPFVYVVLSAEAFDAAAMAKDGSYNESDLMAHPAPTLQITIVAADGSLAGIRMRDADGAGADFRCEAPDLVTLTRNEPTVVAGSFACEEHKVSFEATVLPAP